MTVDGSETSSAPTPAPAAEAEWERLSSRKLLLDPLRAIRSMLLPLIAITVGASSFGESWWEVAIPVVALGGALLAVLPWFTQQFRITYTQLQYRTGLLNRQMKTAPLDRIRSVDLEAQLLHRLLGIRKVSVGTGVDDDRIELDGVLLARAEELRGTLLAGRHGSASPSPEGSAAAAPVPEASEATAPLPALTASQPPTTEPAAPESPQLESPERVLAEFRWTWLRFAPFDLTRLAVVAAALGVIGQAMGDDLIPQSFWEGFDDQAAGLLKLGLTLFIIGVALACVVAWVLVAMIGFVVQWWGLRLTRRDDTLNLTHGLLDTRSISVEEKRVRGVEISEPLLLRPVRGAELSTLATGVGSGGSTRILPHAPTATVRTVGEEVLGVPGPLNLTLISHGPLARRRSHIRQQWGTLFLAALGLAGHLVLERWGDVELALPLALAPAAAWIPVAALRAELAYRHLGHALTPTHLVVGSGTTARVRTVLETDGIIGWVVERTWFQRRLGLCTLTATTAAGGESVELIDVAESVALELMQRSTPEAVAPFLA